MAGRAGGWRGEGPARQQPGQEQCGEGRGTGKPGERREVLDHVLGLAVCGGVLCGVSVWHRREPHGDECGRHGRHTGGQREGFCGGAGRRGGVAGGEIARRDVRGCHGHVVQWPRGGTGWCGGVVAGHRGRMGWCWGRGARRQE